MIVSTADGDAYTLVSDDQDLLNWYTAAKLRGEEEAGEDKGKGRGEDEEGEVGRKRMEPYGRSPWRKSIGRKTRKGSELLLRSPNR